MQSTKYLKALELLMKFIAKCNKRIECLIEQKRELEREINTGTKFNKEVKMRLHFYAEKILQINPDKKMENKEQQNKQVGPEIAILKFRKAVIACIAAKKLAEKHGEPSGVDYTQAINKILQKISSNQSDAERVLAEIFTTRKSRPDLERINSLPIYQGLQALRSKCLLLDKGIQLNENAKFIEILKANYFCEEDLKTIEGFLQAVVT